MLGGRVEGVIEGAMSKIECKAIRHRRSSRNRDARFGGADVRLSVAKKTASCHDVLENKVS